MSIHIVRVWLPDRPGALGAVASRIGAVRGDVVGIDILERGAGQAIDELLVEIPDDELLPLLVAEVSEVDGVVVEDVRAVPPGSSPDPRLDALETAEVLMTKHDQHTLLDALVARARADFEADWTAVVDSSGASVRASVGPVPPAPWLAAFLAGSRSSERVAAGECGPDDVAWASLPAGSLSVALGRRGRPFRSRERRQLAALARIADHRWSELVARAAFPSAAPR